ncbi:ParB/RepB/Spo0J family partition protein [Bosea minatitlanensis]|uniref:ParB/RepB/Spo0J family partition protein n=1 Tax=Bosea minatitlanensis TaxID=128782 RepID=A0ABW0EYG2_9HYPH|nr:ParB/RepB/Spo0J family partition protein [Bosea minatitlanensis]MCT4491764.1 ParB/RepB/Spo0J family partition protein [Bosea minatitlanensis]
MSLLATLTAGSPVFLAAVAAIDATGRLRPVDEAHAQLIATSMNESGLIQPVVVRIDASGNGLKLVVGGHRLRGANILSWEEIPAILIECSDDEARQIEIDENLARKELTALERAEFLAERKRVYETLHPEAAHGKAKKPKTEKGKVANLATFARFSKDAANSTGLSERTIRRACELAGRLSPDAIAAIRGTKVADNQAQLQALAELEPEQQKIVAGLIAAKAAGNVAKARIVAGFVPEGGAVREADRPLARIEPMLMRMSVADLTTLIAMAQAQIAAKTPPAKPAGAKKGGAA